MDRDPKTPESKEPAEVSALPTSAAWKEPAHPSAQVVVRESLASMDRLLDQLNSLDAKASYLAAGLFVMIAGFIAGVATKPPTDPHLQDVMVAAFAFYLVALFFVGDAWWPRPVDAPPHPRGLREHHFNDREENVLLEISNQVASSFDDTKKVAARKSRSIKVGLIVVAFAATASCIVVATSLIQGGPH
ncbi:MAG: hypothetical protein DLM66_03715 [Candidatus Dormiibacter spiritus]|nr:MAG: hypothetical protein DLM66_03715 [Candidatus Dormibacteraeota bacterium]